MAIPNLNKFRDPTGRVGFVPKRTDGFDGELIQYDSSLDEWNIDGDRIVTESNLSSTGGLLEEGDDIDLSTNPSTGSTQISVEDQVDFDLVTLTSNNTADTSGDIQIRDDSTGDLFSLDDGNSPALSARYEGNGAFTFGYRDDGGNGLGTNSVALGGSFSFPVEASAEKAVAMGEGAEASAAAAIALSGTASGIASIAAANGTASATTAIAMGVSTTASGEDSVAMGGETTASDNRAVAIGSSGEASGNSSLALGSYTTASGFVSTAIGSRSIASSSRSTAIGYNVISRATGNVTVGRWNQDYLGSGNEVNDTENLQNSDRIFAIGVGDDPTTSPADTSYFDGRGRVDGLYVTMRDGTHIRHGLSVDGYNASTGQYETVFEINEAGDITEGNIDVSNVDVTAAGTDTEVQFNDGGSFGASPDFTWDGTSLTVNGKYQLTDSTGTYDAVNFESNGNGEIEWFTSGSLSSIAGRSSNELYIGSTTPSSLPSSGVGPGNTMIGSGVLGENATLNAEINNSHIVGNYNLWNSTVNGDEAEMMLSGYGSGYSTTFDNSTTQPTGSKINFTAVGSYSASSADFTQISQCTVIGYAAAFNATGNYGFTTAVGHSALRRSSDITDTTAIGSNILDGTSNVKGSFFLGSFAGTSNISNSGGSYRQPDGITGSIVIGNSAIATKDNQAVLGAAPEQAPNFNPEISEVVFGRGPFADNPDTVEITTTNVRSEPASVGVNGDKQGGNMVISSGRGTGSGTASYISFKTPDTNVNTYDHQVLDERLKLNEDGVKIRNGRFFLQSFNDSAGQYETVFEVDETGSIVEGSISVDGSNLDAAGPDSAIQFNQNDNFDGSSDLTWNGSTLGVNNTGSSLLVDLVGGYRSHTSGSLVNIDDNRDLDYSLNQRTTDGKQSTLKIDSQGTDILPDAQKSSTWEFSGKVVARVESANASKTNAINGDSHIWEFEGAFKSIITNASTGEEDVRFIGQPVVETTFTDPEVENYSVDITKNDNGELLINVTGEDGATVNWSGRLEVMELVA